MDKQTILTAAVKVAEIFGYRAVLKRHIASRLNIGMGTVNYHWGTMDELRAAIVREAINTGNRQVVMQAIAVRDPLVWHKNLSPTLRRKLTDLGIAANA